ncbi:GP158 protein, partial [Todus mexicanus]|nr:GP158 protein [Todus mexicanus]
CRPCRQGCATCEDDVPCLIQEDWTLRAAVLSCQACCMLAVFLSMLISYHYRRSKARAIRTSGVILLETILFGSLLLYFPVFIQYFKPSIFRCIVLRWVRMLGFAIVYGTITLKLYSEGARAWPRLPRGVVEAPSLETFQSCLDEFLWDLVWVILLRQWGDWTGGALEPRSVPCWQRGWRRWVLSIAPPLSPAAEMLFLLWGSFLCYATRAVPSAFHEPRYMGIALHNELMVSAAFHVVSSGGGETWPGFPRVSGTPSGSLDRGPSAFQGPPPHPQFLHAGSPLREEIAAEVYEDELDMRRSGSYLTSSIASAWSEHSLDPDDIR